MPSELNSDPARLVHFLPMSSVSEQGAIIRSEIRELHEVAKGYTYFENGDVLVAKITPCMENGKATFVSGLKHGLGFGSTEFHVLRPKSKSIFDGRYLFYMIWNSCFRHAAGLRMTGSGGQKRVPKRFLETFEIPFPSVAEQKRIASILDKADAIRQQAGNYKALTDRFLQSKFALLFGDPKRNPQGWKEVELQSVAKLKSGVTKGRKLIGKTTVDVPYMRVWNVQDAHIRMDDVKTIEVLSSDIEKYRLEEGDLLLTEGGDPDQLGRGAIWYSPIPVCIHQNHIFRVRANRDLVTPEFLSAMVGSEYCKQYFLRMAKQTTGIASINMTQLKRCPVMLPPLDLQRKFSEFDFKLKKTIQNLERRRVVGDELFNSIAQKAFKGEL